jgi:plasmid stabilization system protein ParE
MPEKYTVKITPQAQEQLREIISYIRFTLLSPGTALKMLDTLQKEISSLDQFPNRVPLTEEEPFQAVGQLSAARFAVRGGVPGIVLQDQRSISRPTGQ